MKTLQPILLTCILAGTSLTASAATLSIVASEDTMLRGGTQAQNNFGGAPIIFAGTLGDGAGLHDLFRFSLANPLLAGATINSVTLTLTATGNDGSSQNANYTVNLHQLASANADWVEGTANDTAQSGSSTWNKKISGTSNVDWAGSVGASTAGTDYLSTTLASFTGNPNTITAGTAMAFTSQSAFQSTVQSTIGGDLNLWLGAVSDAGSRNLFRIASSENDTVANRPTLTIDFTPVPEPSTGLLMGGAMAGLMGMRRRRAVGP